MTGKGNTTEEMSPAIEYSEVYIGECVAGECNLPATVRVHENYVLCALHDLRREIAEEQDEANLALEMITGWRSVAASHNNGYLLELFEYAHGELIERRSVASQRLRQLERVDLETDPNEHIRIEMGEAEAKTGRDRPGEGEGGEAEEPGAIGRVVGELATGRGYASLAELAEAINAQTGEDYTAAELADWPRPGFGGHLDAVLGLSEEERERLVAAVVDRIHEPR